MERRGLLIGGALTAAAVALPSGPAAASESAAAGGPAQAGGSAGAGGSAAAGRWSFPEHRGAARLRADGAYAAKQVAALSAADGRAERILARMQARQESVGGVVFDRSGSALVARGRRSALGRRAAAGVNAVVPLGYVIKADDYPYATTALAPAAAVTTRPVRVAMIDTGLAGQPRTDGWLAQATGDADTLDVVAPAGRLDFGAGHGTFTSGIVQRVAPQAEIAIHRFTGADGIGTDQDVADLLLLAAAEGHAAGVPTIINASLGTPAVDGAPPPAMQAAVAYINATYPDVLIVAAAGNLGTDEPVYPAAFDGVVAVGSLTDAMTAAPFSSHGPWLSVSTVGVGVVSTFVPGISPPEPTPSHPDQAFGANAWAMWTGTSFSAPQISGAIARLCYETPGLTPRAALASLLAGAPALAGYGRTLRLLPGTPTV